MTLTIDLKPATQARLQRAAQNKGVPLSDYAEEILERFAEADTTAQPLTLAFKEDVPLDYGLYCDGFSERGQVIIPFQDILNARNG
jgi:hypothetical protein